MEYRQWKDSTDNSTVVAVSFAVAGVAFAASGFILHFISSLMVRPHISWAFFRPLYRPVVDPAQHMPFSSLLSLMV